MLGFQYAPESLSESKVCFHDESLNVSRVCFDEEYESVNTYEESRKIKMLLTGVDMVNLEQCIQLIGYSTAKIKLWKTRN